MSNNFDDFGKLPVELQREAIREGELRVSSQLQIATAADQRALSWGGLLVAAVTAALGGGIALATKAVPDYPIAFLAIAFAGALTWAAWDALSTAKPELFHVPGNVPSNWVPGPEQGDDHESVQQRRARREQAECLDAAIAVNARLAQVKAGKLLRSFKIAKLVIASGAAVLLLILIIRASEWPTMAAALLSADHSSFTEGAKCSSSQPSLPSVPQAPATTASTTATRSGLPARSTALPISTRPN